MTDIGFSRLRARLWCEGGLIRWLPVLLRSGQSCDHCSAAACTGHYLTQQQLSSEQTLLDMRLEHIGGHTQDTGNTHVSASVNCMSSIVYYTGQNLISTSLGKYDLSVINCGKQGEAESVSRLVYIIISVVAALPSGTLELYLSKKRLRKLCPEQILHYLITLIQWPL